MTSMRPDILIADSLRQIVQEFYPGVTVPRIEIVHPDQEQFGDYSSNIAMIIAPQLKRRPAEIAEEIQRHFHTDAHNFDTLQKVEVVGGFINFYLRDNYYLDALSEIMQQAENFGQNQELETTRVVLEFGQPNTHKMPHIGHLFSYIYGESCARLLLASGAEVKRVNYQGDIGLHVAKCLWAYQRAERKELSESAQRVGWLQQCYQDGSAAYDADESAKKEIDDLNVALYTGEQEVTKLWQETRAWSLEYYDQFERRLGITYDKHYVESEIADKGKELVTTSLGNVFVESDGAIIFPGEKYGLHTRVFINQRGFPTYEAKDMGLAAQKTLDFPNYNYVVNTAVEQNDYWRVIIKAIDLVMPAIAGRTKHLGFGMVELPSGKMSSRSGNIITAVDLVDTVQQRVAEFIRRERPDYSTEERQSIAQAVGLAAIRYAFLRKVAAKNMTFDIEASVALDGNSGPYLQYAYTRCRSLQTKAGTTQPHIPRGAITWQPEELTLARHLSRFPEVIMRAARDYAPHDLCTYLHQVAQKFSVLYDRHKIITDDEQTTGFRLALTASTAHVLKNGLHLLGIDVLEKM